MNIKCSKCIYCENISYYDKNLKIECRFVNTCKDCPNKKHNSMFSGEKNTILINTDMIGKTVYYKDNRTDAIRTIFIQEVSSNRRETLYWNSETGEWISEHRCFNIKNKEVI